MNPSRMTRTLGVAAGGLLAAAFLPMAVAFADDPAEAADDVLTYFNPQAAPLNVPIIEEVNGIQPFFQDIMGTQGFSVDDITAQGSSTSPVVVGTLLDYYSQWALAGGVTNTEYTVGQFVGALQPTFTNLPGDGSVFDTLNFGSTGLENVYSDVLSGSGSSLTSTVSDNLEFDGTTILNLTPLVEAFGINPADFTLF